MHHEILALRDGQTNDSDDRRIYKWRFDKNINISSLIAGAAILWTVISYGSAIVEAQKITGQKVTIMWEYFIQDKPELHQLFR